MFCGYCGKENDEGYSFCIGCGKPLDNKFESNSDFVSSKLDEDSEPQENDISPDEDDEVVWPWRRYFARQLDYLLGATILSLILAVYYPESELLENDVALGIVSVFIWVFIESFLLATFGTTIGKALFSIRLVTAEGDSLNFFQALRRSFAVYIRGIAMGFAFITLLTMANAYFKLKSNKITTWDKNGGFLVRHSAIGPGKVIFITIIFSLYLLLIINSLQ
jgi:uncharacterized RDD family membrane protein YckC